MLSLNHVEVLTKSQMNFHTKTQAKTVQQTEEDVVFNAIHVLSLSKVSHLNGIPFIISLKDGKKNVSESAPLWFI